jgi:HSP20 family protein
MAMTLTRWSPIGALASLEIDRLNRMFEAFDGEPFGRGTWVPVDIFETPEKDVVIKADLPEFKREDITVTYENNVLTIEGQRPVPTDVPRERYHRMERGYGHFRRSFTLPPTVDGNRVSASYQGGVLTITLPQREDARPRQIQVNG